MNKLVTILENAYNDVVKNSEGMGQESVVLPARLIEILHLDEILSSGDIRLGKALLDMIIAAFGIVKGTLQYVSAFDWTFNTSSITTNMTIDDFITAVKTGNNLFTITNITLLEKSRNSFIESIGLIMSSYDYMLTSTSEIYPDEVKDILHVYSILYDAAEALTTALKDGGTFYVPDANIFELTNWPTTDNGNYLVKIDCGKAFSSSVADNAIEKDSSGKINFYTDYYLYGSYHYQVPSEYNEDYYENKWGYIDSSESTEVPLTGSFSAVHNKNVEEVKNIVRDEIKNAIPENATSIYYNWECYSYLLVKVKLPSCITIKDIAENERETFLRIWGVSSDFILKNIPTKC